jgi:molybdenum cofactor cytidylyltransferase
MDYSAILLAAGRSSRMGKHKGLLSWGEKPLIEYQLEQLSQSYFTDIIVVLGYQAELYDPYISNNTIKTIINNDYDLGKTNSIKKGIQEAVDNTKAYLIVNIDTPITTNLVNNMLTELSDSKAKIVIPTFKRKRGHPILLDSSIKNEILSVEEETEGLKHIIRNRQSSIVKFPVDHELVLANLNTLSDYQSFKSKCERSRSN